MSTSPAPGTAPGPGLDLAPVRADGPAADQVALGRLTGFVGFRMRRIQARLSRDFAERTRDYRLGSGAMSALGIIDANPGISQARVAREIGQDASAAVALIEKLRVRGWVQRERLAEDRRVYAIRLTDEGRRVLDDLLATLAEVEGVVLAAISSHDLLVLGRSLDRMYDASFGQGT